MPYSPNPRAQGKSQKDGVKERKRRVQRGQLSNSVFRASTSLWLSEQNLRKIKPASFAAGAVLGEARFLVEGCGGERVRSFVRKEAPGKLPGFQWLGSHSVCLQTALIELRAYF